jgi:uncharacterized protein with FMN-binding domain
MRRTLLSIVAALFCTALLVGLKSQALANRLGVVADAPPDPGSGATDGGGTGSGQPGPTGSASSHATAAGGGSTPKPTTTPGPPGSTPRPGQTTTPPAGGTTTTTTTPPGGGGPTTTTAPPASKTVTGAAIAVRTAESPNTKSSACSACASYTISVTLTVAGGKITAATAAFSPNPSGESGSDANRAKSSLLPKILSAQTWNVGPVSSATYAANAIELSAKDAMSKAGLAV